MHRHKAAYIYSLERAWELSLHDDLALVFFTKNLLFVDNFSMNSYFHFKLKNISSFIRQEKMI